MDAEHIRDLFAQFRPLDVRRMFGGTGLFADGTMLGLVFDGMIYLKTSAATLPDFQREGSVPFVYPLARKLHPPRRKPSSYWRLPERLYDDPEELARWAAAALTAAQKKSSAKSKAARVRRAAGKTKSKRR